MHPAPTNTCEHVRTGAGTGRAAGAPGHHPYPSLLPNPKGKAPVAATGRPGPGRGRGYARSAAPMGTYRRGKARVRGTKRGVALDREAGAGGSRMRSGRGRRHMRAAGTAARPCDSALRRAALPCPASGCRLVACRWRYVCRLPLLVAPGSGVWAGRACVAGLFRARMIGADSWSAQPPTPGTYCSPPPKVSPRFWLVAWRRNGCNNTVWLE